MVDSFFSSMVERRMTVASRKEILDAMLMTLAILDQFARLRDNRRWINEMDEGNERGDE